MVEPVRDLEAELPDKTAGLIQAAAGKLTGPSEPWAIDGNAIALFEGLHGIINLMCDASWDIPVPVAPG